MACEKLCVFVLVEKIMQRQERLAPRTFPPSLFDLFAAHGKGRIGKLGCV